MMREGILVTSCREHEGKSFVAMGIMNTLASMSADDQKVMVEKRRELRSAGDEAAVLLTGKDAPWSTGKYWYADPMINEYQYSWQQVK